jgi:hypothetical protein
VGGVDGVRVDEIMVDGRGDAWEETICGTWVVAAAMARFVSPIEEFCGELICIKGENEPEGWPSLASAAALMNIGIDDWKPNILVEGQQVLTRLRTLGRKKKRENARAFSMFAGQIK